MDRVRGGGGGGMPPSLLRRSMWGSIASGVRRTTVSGVRWVVGGPLDACVPDKGNRDDAPRNAVRPVSAYTSIPPAQAYNYG